MADHSFRIALYRLYIISIELHSEIITNTILLLNIKYSENILVKFFPNSKENVKK